MTKSRSIGVAAVCGLGQLIAGCAWRHLVPADSARRVDGRPDAALAEASGVRVSADPGAWDGSMTVAQELTPVRLSIRNDSGRPISVPRLEIMLAGSTRKLPALAPGKISARTVTAESSSKGAMTAGPAANQPEEIAMNRPGPVDRPQADNFQGAGHGELARNAPSPKEVAVQEELQRAALPEGAVQSGQELAGFVYFARLPKDFDRADLRIVIRDGSGKPFTTLSIPFTVK
jgi:hypothetical protein